MVQILTERSSSELSRLGASNLRHEVMNITLLIPIRSFFFL
jgi:hypothetical protein